MGRDQHEHDRQPPGRTATRSAPPEAPAWARYWQGLGLAVGPMYHYRDAQGKAHKGACRGIAWAGAAPDDWFHHGAPVDNWRDGWRLVGCHLGRSRLIVLDLDAPGGAHKADTDGAPLEPIAAQLAALAAMIGAAALERPAFAWDTLTGGRALAWYLPPGAEPPPGRRIRVPGLSHTVEVRSGAAVHVLPSGPLADGSPGWTLAAGLEVLPPDAAPPCPPALWAAMTAPRAADGAGPGAADARPARAPIAPLDGTPYARALRRHIEGIARRIGSGGERWQDDGLALRMRCPLCTAKGKTDRRLKVAVRADGALVLHCRGKCSPAAVAAAAREPIHLSLRFDRPRLDVRVPADAALAGALGRVRFAALARLAAMLEAAPPAERRAMRQRSKLAHAVVDAVLSACAAAGSLEAPIARSTLALLTGANERTLRRSLAWCLKALRGLVSDVPVHYRDALADFGTVSTRYRVTVPPEGEPAAPLPMMLRGSNTARGLSPSKRGRPETFRALEVLNGRGPLTLPALRAAFADLGLPVPSPATAARWLAVLERDGLVTAETRPPAGRGRPAKVYTLTAAAADAIGARSDADLAALLPDWRQHRGDAAAARVTADRRALEDAYDGAEQGEGWAAAIAVERSRRERDKARRRAARHAARVAGPPAAAETADAVALPIAASRPHVDPLEHAAPDALEDPGDVAAPLAATGSA